MALANQRHTPIDAALFTSNRARLAAKLQPGSLVVVQANDVMPTNADGVMPFHQNSDLRYLTGIAQEETILLLYVGAAGQAPRSILFLKKTSPAIALWEGHKYTAQEAQTCSGIEEVHELAAFPQLLHQLMGQAEYVYLPTNEHSRASVALPTRDLRFVKTCQERYPLHRYRRLAPLMQALRTIKAAEEIALLRRACAITGEGLQALIQQVRPGVMEYALEAELIHTYTRQGADGFAYTPIVASGANTCVLHYTANSRACQAGALLLVDAGARYAGYCADMTRTLPVSGRFTARQKQVYQAVLAVMKHAQSLLVAGQGNLHSYHEAVGRCMEEQLLQLGLLSTQEVRNQDPQHPAYKRYFMHGTSHYLGLETHDVGDFHRTFEAGMVVTVEPGIYIAEEGLGIRLENVMVLHEDGVEDLTAHVPLEPEAIEEAMHPTASG